MSQVGPLMHLLFSREIGGDASIPDRVAGFSATTARVRQPAGLRDLLQNLKSRFSGSVPAWVRRKKRLVYYIRLRTARISPKTASAPSAAKGSAPACVGVEIGFKEAET